MVTVTTITLPIKAILALIVGVLIIANPKLIKWLLGGYLILIGVLGLIDFAFI